MLAVIQIDRRYKKSQSRRKSKQIFSEYKIGNANILLTKLRLRDARGNMQEKR